MQTLQFTKVLHEENEKRCPEVKQVLSLSRCIAQTRSWLIGRLKHLYLRMFIAFFVGQKWISTSYNRSFKWLAVLMTSHVFPIFSKWSDHSWFHSCCKQAINKSLGINICLWHTKNHYFTNDVEDYSDITMNDKIYVKDRWFMLQVTSDL